MRGVNKVIIVGTLGQDPEVRYMANGKAVVNLSVATNEKCKDSGGQLQERTEWHKVVLWGRTAEIAGEYLKKGSQAYFEGKLTTEKWQDQQGNDRYTTKVVANQMQMLNAANRSGQSNQSSKPVTNTNLNPDGSPKTPEQMQRGATAKQSEPDFDFDDYIPF